MKFQLPLKLSLQDTSNFCRALHDTSLVVWLWSSKQLVSCNGIQLTFVTSKRHLNTFHIEIEFMASSMQGAIILIGVHPLSFVYFNHHFFFWLIITPSKGELHLNLYGLCNTWVRRSFITWWASWKDNKFDCNKAQRQEIAAERTAAAVLKSQAILILIPLFVHQCHEQEIPEVIPIEGIPFLNQSKSTQLNTTQIKSNKSNVGFEERGKPEYPECPIMVNCDLNAQTMLYHFILP